MRLRVSALNEKMKTYSCWPAIPWHEHIAFVPSPVKSDHRASRFDVMANARSMPSIAALGSLILIGCVRPVHRPIAGTNLIREWQGVEHCVTVRAEDFEYLGRPYKSLSSVAHEITGTKWNGWVFFGLKNHQSRT